MKLRYVTGCICDSLEIDDKQFNEMSLGEQAELCHTLIENIQDSVTLQELFIKWIECEGEYKQYEPCECCGDVICEYTKEL